MILLLKCIAYTDIVSDLMPLNFKKLLNYYYILLFSTPSIDSVSEKHCLLLLLTSFLRAASSRTTCSRSGMIRAIERVLSFEALEWNGSGYTLYRLQIHRRAIINASHSSKFCQIGLEYMLFGLLIL